MTEPRTISFDMTWTAAAQIIAAALENGTATGRDAARAELFRMAQMLDDMRQADAEPTTLYEIIAHAPESISSGYGVAFATAEDAASYADRLEHLGYTADRLEPWSAVPLPDGLQQAALFFSDPRIADAETDGSTGQADAEDMPR